MSIAQNHARLLLHENRRDPFSGSIIQLGRQDIFFTMKDLTRWAHKDRSSLMSVEETLSKKEWLRKKQFIDDKTFFGALGFSSIDSCDFSEYENPTFIINLNESAYSGPQYDVVYDGGTFEHIFHIPNCFRAAHLMLKTGGRIVHFSSFNWVDHGYYMFSPVLFAEYYAANNYELEQQYVVIWRRTIDRNRRFEIRDIKAFAYEPGGSMDWLPTTHFSGFQEFTVGHFVVARKTENSSAALPPIQGAYQSLWATNAGSKKEARGRKSLFRRIYHNAHDQSSMVRMLRRRIMLWRRPKPSIQFKDS